MDLNGFPFEKGFSCNLVLGKFDMMIDSAKLIYEPV
jgi:hypothetical protein